jgi:hypothetical protein
MKKGGNLKKKLQGREPVLLPDVFSARAAVDDHSTERGVRHLS